MKKVELIGILFLSTLFVMSTLSCSKTNKNSRNISKYKAGFVYSGSISADEHVLAHDKGRMAVEAMGVRTAFVENIGDDDAQGCEAAIRNLIETQGCNIIFATSYGYMDTTAKLAEEYPKVYFNHCSSDIHNSSNLGSYFGKIYEARYLAGIIAGKTTTTNRLGYVAAYPSPECIRGINAYTLGARSVNPKAIVEVRWTHDWDNPEAEEAMARKLISRKCDVLTYHQNSTTVQQVAQEKGVYCIGYYYSTPDIAPDAYLTAVIFDWENYYKKAVQSIQDGTWTPTFTWLGIKEKVVELDKFSSLVPESTIRTVIEKMAKVSVGTLNPFEGPIYDQIGVERVAEGEVLYPEEIWTMDWFVKGVAGKLN